MTAVLAANYSAPVSAAAGTVTIGQVLVSSGTAGYVVATAANRTSYGRPDGIAITAGDSRTPVVMIEVGPIPASMTGLGSGTAVPVRVSSAGALERVATPTSSDEVVGYCETDGRAHVLFGVLTHRMYVDSGGGGTPGGSSGDLQTNNAGSFGGLSPGTSGNLCTSNGSAWTSTAPSFAASVIASGQLVHERGGLEADVSAYNGLVRIASGSTSAVALPLAATNGGTGLSALGTGLQYLRTNAGATAIEWASLPTFPSGTIVGTSDSQTLTTKTFNVADNSLTATSGAQGDLLYHNGTKYVRLAKGAGGTVLMVNALGTDISWSTPTVDIDDVTDMGANVAAFLKTPSSANLAAAVTGETGSGALVFGTAPTISGATLTGVSIISAQRITGTTTNSSTGTQNDVSLGGNRKIRFTHASGTTVTGLDATGIADGDIVYLICLYPTDITHEDAGSTAANRFDLRAAGTRSLGGGSVYPVMYDGTSSRWRLFGADYTNP